MRDRIRGALTVDPALPFAGKSAFCRIVADPPNQAEATGVPPAVIRRVPTDAEGRCAIAGIPVGTRCTLRGSLQLGDTLHLATADIRVTKPGPSSVPDLVLKPQERTPMGRIPGKAE
jgi:hypothetical protein